MEAAVVREVDEDSPRAPLHPGAPVLAPPQDLEHLPPPDPGPGLGPLPLAPTPLYLPTTNVAVHPLHHVDGIEVTAHLHEDVLAHLHVAKGKAEVHLLDGGGSHRALHHRREGGVHHL